MLAGAATLQLKYDDSAFKSFITLQRFNSESDMLKTTSPQNGATDQMTGNNTRVSETQRSHVKPQGRINTSDVLKRASEQKTLT